MSNELIIPFVYAGEVLSGAIILPIVGACIVSLRFYMRIQLKQKLGMDDWSIFVAWPLVTGMCICLIYGVAKKAIGFPSPPYPVQLASPIVEELTETTSEQTTVFIMDWTIWMLMIPGNGLIKISALFLYRRIFVVNKGGFLDLSSKLLLTICLLWTIAFFFAQLFGCGSHFGAPFGTLEDVASCNTNMRLNGLMVSDLVTDILVWLFPIVPVWQLRMSVAKKLSVTGVLMLAAISLAAAIVRLIVQLEIASGGYSARTDPNLTLTILLYWSMLESNLALIATCLPTIHVYWFRQSVGSIYGSLRNLLSTHRSRGFGVGASDDDADSHFAARGTHNHGTTSQRANFTKRAEFEMTSSSGKNGDVESQMPGSKNRMIR